MKHNLESRKNKTFRAHC